MVQPLETKPHLLTGKSGILLILLAFICEAAIAYFHGYLPDHTNLVLFYAIPIILVAWTLGFAAGFALTVWSVGLWFFTQEGVDPGVLYWNTGIRAALLLSLLTLIEIMKRTWNARARAEARLEARKVFLASVSHEFRNPLQRILSGVELLGGTESREIESIRQSTNELVELVDSMIDLTRLETGAIGFLSDFNPVAVVREMLDQLGPVVVRKKQNFTLQIDPATPTFIRADLSCLRHGLARLLRDASEFSEAGAIVVLLGIANQTQLQITVKDSGQRSQIASATDMRDGLGFHLARELARLNKGNIWRDTAQSSEVVHHFTISFERL
ncbi:MAG: HAMP domain-containing histidine kinase [Spirochaetia bacterium]|nr:HAMP domain-containing histidine kinase [Spirochaetia bacterium]